MQDTGKHQLRDTNASLAAPLGPSHHLCSPSGMEQEIKARGDPERGFEARKSGNVFIAGLIIYQDKLESRALRIREIPTELSLPTLHPARSCFWGLPTSFLQLPGFQFPSSRGKTHWFFFGNATGCFHMRFPASGGAGCCCSRGVITWPSRLGTGKGTIHSPDNFTWIELIRSSSSGSAFPALAPEIGTTP